MLKIKKEDTVLVTKGKDAGKKGRVLKLFATEGRALVEGINMFKKNKRQTRQDQQGGIVSIEVPISIANLMLVCKGCLKPARVGFKQVAEGKKERFCKACNEVI